MHHSSRSHVRAYSPICHATRSLRRLRARRLFPSHPSSPSSHAQTHTYVTQIRNPEHKTNTIQHIRLSRAIQARDRVELIVKAADDGTLGVRLEAIDADFFNVHGARDGRSWTTRARRTMRAMCLNVSRVRARFKASLCVVVCGCVRDILGPTAVLRHFFCSSCSGELKRHLSMMPT